MSFLTRSSQCTRSGPKSGFFFANAFIVSQRRHFVKPRSKVRDPLADAPSTTILYPIETQGVLDEDKSHSKLTFIHRPPPTSPSPFSTITAPASPLLRSPTKHEGVYKGIVTLLPGKAPIVTKHGNPTRKEKTSPLTSSELEERRQNDEPPLLKQYPHVKKRNLSEKDLVRMRALRQENPELYTRSRLAKMFKCSPVFVSMAAPLPRGQLHKVWRAQREQQQGWTWRKQMLREMKKKRRSLW
ncbi:hypothetical protein FRC16_008859 [Serendipita sp. 398]|nr:hypothetical protein FRC16_008859 [Serendipita sp. 398]